MRRRSIFTIIFLIFIITSCNKEVGVYPLNEMKKQNPFSGNETLKFLSNSNDTIVFIGQGRYTENFRSPYDGSSSKKYYTNEMDICSFTDNENNYELFFQLASRTLRVDFGGISETTGYLMTIWLRDQSGTNTTSCRSIANDIPLPIIDYQHSNFFYDSLLINNVYYHNVVSFQNSRLLYNGECSGRMKVDSIFYCISNGIIKLEFEDNTSWGLLNIDTN